MSGVLKMKEEPTPGRSERNAGGKGNSRCKDPEAGPAVRPVSDRHGKKPGAAEDAEGVGQTSFLGSRKAREGAKPPGLIYTFLKSVFLKCSSHPTLCDVQACNIVVQHLCAQGSGRCDKSATI